MLKPICPVNSRPVHGWGGGQEALCCSRLGVQTFLIFLMSLSSSLGVTVVWVDWILWLSLSRDAIFERNTDQPPEGHGPCGRLRPFTLWKVSAWARLGDLTCWVPGRWAPVPNDLGQCSLASWAQAAPVPSPCPLGAWPESVPVASTTAAFTLGFSVCVFFLM